MPLIDVKSDSVILGDKYDTSYDDIDTSLNGSTFLSSGADGDAIREFRKQAQLEANNMDASISAYDDSFLGGAVEMLSRDNYEQDGFDPFDMDDELYGYPLDSYDYILEARNRTEYERRKLETINSMAAREVNRKTSFLGNPLPYIGAAVFDPAIALPAGSIIRGAKGGISIAKTMANTGIAGVVAGSFTEGFAQQGDPLRSAEEGAVSPGS